jgi:hypothetical protein
MRAVYSYLPACYLNGNYYLDKLEKKKQAVFNHFNQKKEGDLMAQQSKGFSTGEKLKLVGLLAGLAAFFYFSNPMDNKYIKQIAGEEVAPVAPLASQAPVIIPSIPVAQSSLSDNCQIQVTDDFIRQLFDNYRPNLTMYMSSPKFGVSAVIDFYDGKDLHERLTMDDFHRYGYSVTPSGQAVYVKGVNFQKRVTTWNFQDDSISKPLRQDLNSNLAIASRLQR